MSVEKHGWAIQANENSKMYNITSKYFSFFTINHLQAESRILQGIFLNVILVRIIVPWLKCNNIVYFKFFTYNLQRLYGLINDQSSIHVLTQILLEISKIFKDFIFHQFRVFVHNPIPKNKRVRRKLQKVLFTVPVMDSGYRAQLDHSILMFTYTIDYFSNLFFSFELVSNKKLGRGMKIDI